MEGSEGEDEGGEGGVASFDDGSRADVRLEPVAGLPPIGGDGLAGWAL